MPVLVCILSLTFCQLLFARDHPKPLPLLVRHKTDIMIWDEQYLRGPPKGWTVPEDYHASMGGVHANTGNAIRFGRFGHLSGRLLYTTWRPLHPLSDAAYAEGKTTIYDRHTSNLLTPPFEITLDYITFLISGGYAPAEACVNLLVGDKVVRTATGRNNDMLEWVAFDVKALRGKTARIQVLDTSSAAFGYITCDCFCQSPDTKNALRVISTPPAPRRTVSRIETLDGTLTGIVAVNDRGMTVNGRPVDLSGVLSVDTSVPPGDVAAKRVELVNGDVLAGDVLGLEEGKLIFEHPVFGVLSLPLGAVAQALFNPGPSVTADPGTLIHSNGDPIPGELSWIREDNISIKCALGQLPLPRGRVRAFVFAKKKRLDAPVMVVLADGSTISGELLLEDGQIVIKHAVLGAVQVALTDLVRINRRIDDATFLTHLTGEVREQSGPIPPPPPLRVETGSGEALRTFPRTAVRYTLPKRAAPRRFRGVLVPVPNSRIPVTAHIRVGNAGHSYSVPPGSDGVAVVVDLGTASEFELVTDAESDVAYPCGIEWRNAIIVESSPE